MFVKSFKLSIQHIKLFKILEQKSNLAYKLNFLTNQKIYLVIFIAYFELTLNDKDLYNCLKLNYLKIIVELNVK